MSTHPTIIEFFVRGDPAAQPRMKHVLIKPRGRTPFVRGYTPDSADGWKARVQLECYGKVKAPIAEPMIVHIVAYFERPQRLLKPGSPPGPIPMTGKPDKDNLEKAILDAMKNAGIYTDDRLIFDGSTGKYFAPLGSPAGAKIRIQVVPGAETEASLFGEKGPTP